MKVSSNDRGIEHDPLQIGLLKCDKDMLPHAPLRPAVESLKDTVPLAESLRHVTPRRSPANDPQHRIPKLPIVIGAPSRTPRLPRQQTFPPLPLLVRQLKSTHDIPPP